MRKFNVAILGATGAVGQELAQTLFMRQFPINSLKLLSSPRSAGKKLTYNDQEFTVQEVTEDSFKGIDIAFFCAGGSVSEKWASIAVNSGAVVIDNTSAFRLKDDVPLVVPEVNPEEIMNHKGIIANPNCSTILMAVVLKPIHDEARIQRVVVSTYQAVSGAGAQAMEELHNQVVAYVEQKEHEAKLLPLASGAKHYPIAFNAIPQIDVFDEGDYTKEEWKMVRETQKIFKETSLRITATTVRVPVFRSHGESINVELESPLSSEQCREILKKAPGVVVLDNVDNQEYPMPTTTSYKDPVYVGRIRQDYSVENGLNLWVVGDQIRKGAALNAVQIAEYLARHLG